MARREADAEADTDADADADADADLEAGAEAEAESDLVSADRGDAGAASDLGDAGAASDLGEAEGDLVAQEADDAAEDLGEADLSAGDLGPPSRGDLSAGDLGAPSLARAVLARGLGLTLGPAQPIGASRAPSTSSAVRIERARAW